MMLRNMIAIVIFLSVEQLKQTIRLMILLYVTKDTNKSYRWNTSAKIICNDLLSGTLLAFYEYILYLT